jgi:hypothetical protein
VSKINYKSQRRFETYVNEVLKRSGEKFVVGDGQEGIGLLLTCVQHISLVVLPASNTLVELFAG